MALQKEKQLANGTSGNYWKITSVTADKEKLKLHVIISLYVSKQVADSGAPNLKVSHSFQDYFTKQQLSGDLTALGYNLVKSKISGDEPNGVSKPMELRAHRDLHGAGDI